MKKWLPWILVAVMGAWVASRLHAPSESGFHASEFGRLPVLLNGRIQPLDSVARNSLLQIRNKQSVALEDHSQLNATEWLLEVLLKPEVADERKVFRIDHPELLGMLGLPEDQKHFAFNQIRTKLEEIEKQAERINAVPAANRTVFEKQVSKLHNAVLLYQRLKNSLQPDNTLNFVDELQRYQSVITPGVVALRAREAGKDYDQEAFKKLVEFISRYDFMAQMSYPLLIPPAHPEQSRDNWTTMGATLMEVARGATLPPSVLFYARMATAYRGGQPAEFNRAVSEYRQWLSPSFAKELGKGRREFLYSHFEPFYLAMVIYVLAFLLACGSWFNWSEPLRRSAFYLLILAWGVHTSGIVFRMVLEGRPPVTNLYSSAVFVGWGAVALGLILERIYRDGIGAASAATIGFVTQVVAHNLALGGDTMEMMRAVLDTNFWLATHVVVVTLGYSATFFAGFLACFYVLRSTLTKNFTAEAGRSLARMVYGIICFAMLFSFAGTVLGGIWADQSWGRFWGWDPKENGALIIVLWNAIILHARWGHMVEERGLMNLAIFGNIVTSYSWFGVNMLGIGLHSYGFMDAAFRWLMVFVVSQLVLIAIGLVPVKYRVSARSSARARRPSAIGGEHRATS